MAFDPNAQRASIRYNGGRVIAARGLLNYLFGSGDVSDPAVVRTGLFGKRRVVNTIRRATAIGGKQMDIFTKDGKTYQVHYTGAFADFVNNGEPKLDKSKVSGYSTRRGTKVLF